jgi:hypothetical protein
MTALNKSLLSVLLISLLGCAGGPSSQRYQVSVNSFAAPSSETKSRFFILPGLAGVKVSDLEFVEYAGVLTRALEQRGFVAATNLNEADVALFYSYSIGAPEQNQYSYSVPTFGQTGVSSSSTYGTIRSSGYGSATYTGNTYYTPTYGVTGQNTYQGSYVTFTRYIRVDAVDVLAYQQNKEIKQIWTTSMASIGSSADLRSVLPVMIAAGIPHFARSSGKMVMTELRLGDPSVRSIASQGDANGAPLKK